jgi:soluble lytic murein transglycosylase-like protein
MTVRYLIATLLSALLISHFHSSLTDKVVQKPVARPTVITATAIKPVQPIVQQAVVHTYASGCSTYDSIFRLYAWNVRTAEAICQAESGGNPYAVSNARLNFDGVSDFGLMQIHGEAIFNPVANIARAHQKYVSQGWNAWTTYSSGSYLRFL